jgi:hypothetical protein
MRVRPGKGKAGLVRIRPFIWIAGVVMAVSGVMVVRERDAARRVVALPAVTRPPRECP